MREMENSTQSTQQEILSSQKQLLILEKRVIDIEVFNRQRDPRIFDLEGSIRERKSRESITYEVFTRPEPE